MGENLSDFILLAPSDKGMLSINLGCWFGVIFLIFGGFSMGASIFVALVVWSTLPWLTALATLLVNFRSVLLLSGVSTKPYFSADWSS
jgi:predicted branched-subunit amino acid permease